MDYPRRVVGIPDKVAAQAASWGLAYEWCVFRPKLRKTGIPAPVAPQPEAVYWRKGDLN
jgi:hypothetical protein